VAIPDIPSWVGEEMAKLEFQRKEAFKVQAHPPPQPLKSHSDDFNKVFSFILVVVIDHECLGN